MEKALSALVAAMDPPDFSRLTGSGRAVWFSVFAEEQDAHRAHVVSMWVAPDVRREGVGRRLIDAVVEWAQSRKMREVKLMVTSVNHGAIAFYERMGFGMTGNDAGVSERPGYYGV